MAAEAARVKIGRREMEITRPEKVLWCATPHIPLSRTDKLPYPTRWCSTWIPRPRTSIWFDPRPWRSRSWFESVRDFARALARIVVSQAPGKLHNIFIDAGELERAAA